MRSGGEDGMAMPLRAEPSCGRYTVEDWLDLPESSGQRIELIDGSFIVSPAPMSDHQLCAKWLARILDDAAPDGFEAIEAFGVRTANEVPVPDVAVGDRDILRRRTAALLPEQTHLVAEIVSQGNRRRDYRDKPRIYAEAGIPTFLRIELSGIAAAQVKVFHLRDGAYDLVAKVSAGQTLELTQPFPVAFDPARLFGPPSRGEAVDVGAEELE
jgi:Uma2 family endonuclease